MQNEDFSTNTTFDHCQFSLDNTLKILLPLFRFPV